jgi:iron-sulfur cluster repair protein YtfE (RIC family)
MKLIKVSGNGFANPSASATALEMLLGCHARTRHFMQLSQTLVHAECAPYQEIAQASASVLRHFGTVLPLHEADENESLFPRLRAAQPTGGLVREAAETMVEQHKAIQELVTELLPLCASLERQPGRLPFLSHRLDHVAQALNQIFAAHLCLEETVVFPAITEWLSPAQIKEMSREMHGRRRPARGTIHLVQ